MTMIYPFDCLPIHPPPQALETFTSYLIRLAEVNGIQSIHTLRHLLFPNMSFRPHLNLYNTDTLMRSFPSLAQAAHCTLEQLRQTTVFHLVNKFGCIVALPFLQDSLAPTVRFCPDCLRESAYYRLPWRFLAIPGCMKHECLLQDQCPACYQPIPHLSHCLQMARCPHCAMDLRQSPSIAMTKAQHDLTVRRTPDIVYLLTPQDWEADTFSMREGAGAWLRAIRREQHLSSPKVAAALGVSQPTIRHIELPRARREGIRFYTYLAYTDRLDTTWSQVFETIHQQPQLPRDALGMREERLRQQVEAAIHKIEAAGDRLSIMAVSHKVGLSPECFVLYPKVKALADTIPERARQQRENDLLITFQKAVACLQQEGIPITRHAISVRVPSYPDSFASYPRLVDFLSRYIPRELLLLEPRRKTHPREAELVQQIPEVAKRLLRQTERITLKRFSEALGLPVMHLYNYPTLHQQVKVSCDRCRQMQKEQQELYMLQQVEQAIEQLKAEGIPCSNIAISRIVGKHHRVLTDYPRVKALLSQYKGKSGGRR